ncbi:MAG: DNA adenine methylase [Parvibaculaceae bacterium]|nr:DNA adenine methylase [Parvibaculaceae bacterium]
MQHVEIEPVKPLAAYMGGKRNLAGRIVPMIEATPHHCYVEAFVGMGGIFFRRRLQPKAEIINDASREVANLFRIVQRHYVPFAEFLRHQLTTRAEFERLAATDPKTLTDLERAARFIYLQRTGFGGKIEGRSFGTQRTAAARFDVTKVMPMIEDVHGRLTRVVIECLDWRELLDTYDGPGTLFYLDPPYYGTEHVYGRDLFSRDDYAELAERLAALKGRFIMSINDVKPIRETFSAFRLHKVKTTYMVGGGKKAVSAGELIVTPAG